MVYYREMYYSADLDFKEVKKDLRVIGRSTLNHSPIPKDCWVRDGHYLGVPVAYAKSKGYTGEDLMPDIRFDWGESDFKYRHNQEDVVNSAISELESNLACHLSCPTGFGKSACAVRIAELLGVNCLIIAHKVDILKQFERTIKNIWGVDCGWIHGKKNQTDSAVTLTTVQTLSKRLGKFSDDVLSGFSLVIWDEAHHMGADSYIEVASQLNNRYTLGLSATFRRKDKLTPVYEKFLGKKMTGAKISNPPKIYVYSPEISNDLKQSDFIDWRTNEYSHATFCRKLAEDKKANTEIVELIERLFSEGRRSLVFMSTLNQINILSGMLESPHGVYAGELNGVKIKEADLNEALKEKIILATPHKMGEGTDLSNSLGDDFDKPLNTCFILTPSDDTEQQFGRAGRGLVDDFVLVIHPRYRGIRSSYNKYSKCKKIYDKKNAKYIKDLNELFI